MEEAAATLNARKLDLAAVEKAVRRSMPSRPLDTEAQQAQAAATLAASPAIQYPWSCPVAGCDFVALSRTQRNRHV